MANDPHCRNWGEHPPHQGEFGLHSDMSYLDGHWSAHGVGAVRGESRIPHLFFELKRGYVRSVGV